MTKFVEYNQLVNNIVDCVHLLLYNLIVAYVEQRHNNNLYKGDELMKNQEIRQLAKSKGVKLWQIADELQLNDGNFSRLLRRELPGNKVEQIISIINKLSAIRDESR